MWNEEDVIDVYTRQNAIADGAIFKAGRIANREVDLTANLIEKLDKREIAKAIIKALEAARHFRQPDMEEIEVDGKKVWVDDNGSVITLILPEDY